VQPASEPSYRVYYWPVQRENLDGDGITIQATLHCCVRKHAHATPVIDEFEDAGIPYQVAGDLATESVGVGTVTAYLKALAPPEDEVSWNRILLMRVPACATRTSTRSTRATTFVDTLRETPLGRFRGARQMSQSH